MCSQSDLRSRRSNSGRRIRGPQSALTDFLAANNISAVQIQQDYLQRLQENEATTDGEGPTLAAIVPDADGDAVGEGDRDTIPENSRGEKQEADSQTSNSLKRKKAKKSSEFSLLSGRKPNVPKPGQLGYCEICSKRFTVTAYCKSGPQGNLLCMKCSKEASATSGHGSNKGRKDRNIRRRQVQSDYLDGKCRLGPISLQDICIKVA